MQSLKIGNSIQTKIKNQGYFERFGTLRYAMHFIFGTLFESNKKQGTDKTTNIS